MNIPKTVLKFGGAITNILPEVVLQFGGAIIMGSTLGSMLVSISRSDISNTTK